MNKRQLIESLDKVYCRLGKSKHGVGVFAIRDIPFGTNPFTGSLIKDYVAVSPSELNDQPKAIKNLVKDFCPLQKRKYYLPSVGLGAIDVSYYLNHSKHPNMTTDEGEEFIATRLIKEGEELTVDYETYDDRGL